MSFKFKNTMTVALATTMISGAAFAEELRIDRIFVIGDSLSDNGAYTQAVQAIPGATVLEENQILMQNNPIPGRVQLPPTLDRLRTTNNAPDGSSRVYAEVLADRLGVDLDTNVITEVPAATRGALAQTSGDPSYLGLTGEEVGGTNYAQSGSRIAGVSDSQNLALGINAIPATTQIQRLINSQPNFNERDLVVVWAGSNDVLALVGGIVDAADVVGGAAANAAFADALANGSTTAQAAAIAETAGLAAAQAEVGAQLPGAIAEARTAGGVLAEQLAELKAAGATKVVAVTVPDIGANTPLGNIPGALGGAAEVQGVFSALGAAINEELANGISGQDIAVVNADRLLAAVIADPVRYGFSSLDGSTTAYDLNTPNAYECVNDSAVGCIQGTPLTRNDGEDRIFADSIHPTVQAHALFGDAAFSGLVASTQAGAIPVATLTAIRQSSIGIEKRLNLGAIYTNDEAGQRITRPVGDFEVYGGVEIGSFSGDQQQVLPGLEANAQIVKVAFDVPVAPKVVLGAGISLDHGQLEFDDNQGGFDSRLFIGALFGVAEIYRGVYLNGLLGYGHIDVYDIDRRFTLGASKESYNADSDGRYFTAKATLGAMIPVGGGFLINPSVGLTHETVKVNGYAERSTNGGVLAREFGDLEIDSNRGTLALAGFYRPEQAQDWIFSLRGSYEYDFTDDDLTVASREVLMPGQLASDLASFSAPRPDREFGFLSGSITKEFGSASSVTLGASSVLGLDGVSGVTGSLTYKHKF